MLFQTCVSLFVLLNTKEDISSVRWLIDSLTSLVKKKIIIGYKNSLEVNVYLV